MEGAPDNSMLADESKADEVLPRTFDMMELMTPVRSQGRRGTCTIFATTALMESLYVAEGSMTMPDFSEQFLQWSSKVEGMSFEALVAGLGTDWPFETFPDYLAAV